MKVAFLTLYDKLGASSRVRALQFGEALAASGIEATFWPLLSDRYLTAKYAGRSTTREVAACYMRRLRQWRRLLGAELLWIEKELFPYLPYGIEHALLGGRRYVLDLDDAIFHRYDLASSRLERALFRRKIDNLMAGAEMVIAGNAYLAQRARAAGQQRVEVLPSVIDLQRYSEPNLDAPAPAPDRSPVRIAWIGSPATVGYLDFVRDPLERLARVQAVEMLVIGADAPRWPAVKAVAVGWSLSGEAEAIGACDIGIMPLPDGPWERGKCGYKLIQYMACGLPVVASPVGVNATLIDDGVDGYLAADSAQWETALRRLAGDPALRLSMGRRGRQKVVARYTVQAVAPRLVALLTEAAC